MTQKEKLIELIDKSDVPFCDECGKFSADARIELLADFLVERGVVEANAIRHGKWIETDEGDVVCSECGHITEATIAEYEERDDDTIMRFVYPYFCEKCGAEMRGEQVARKPTKVVYPHTDLTSHYVCWACGERVCNGWKYCPECGQAIAWSDEKRD